MIVRDKPAFWEIFVMPAEGPQLLLAWQDGAHGACGFGFGFVDVRRYAA